MKPALSAKGLFKTYPRGPAALRGFELELLPGERVALLGPNGAGKTTLVKIAAGLVAPDGGEVFLFGEPPGPRALRRVGFLFEEAENLYGYLSAWENLLFYGRLYGVPEGELRKRAGRLVAELGLTSRKHALAQSLSRGEKQRLALASVLVAGPELLVLDEPTLGLDLASTERLIAKLRALSTLLLTTHDPYLAWEVAERFVLIKGGRKLAELSKEELLAKGIAGAEGLRRWLLAEVFA